MLPPKDSLESTDKSQVKLCPRCLDRSRWIAANILPHEGVVRAWLGRTTQMSDADIDDTVQETYAILAKLDSVDAIRDPRAYAMQIARSVFLQSLRRSKIVAIESIADLAALQTADDAPSPEQHAHGQRELRRVEAAIETMPIQVRKVFWMRRVEGLSQRETAQRMDLAEHTVEKYMARGVKLLLEQFHDGGNRPRESSRDSATRLVEAKPLDIRSTTGRRD
jgi:RNA polymerase sigma-70 factor (ECF subfamily)